MALPAGKTMRLVRLAAQLLLLFVGGEAIFATSDAGQPPEYCTVFHHMMKSAGSTVKALLSKASHQHKMAKPAVCVTGEARIPACLQAINSSAVIAGCAELLRDPLEKAARNCEYFTVMRNPVDRLVSAFFYCPTDHDVQNRPAKWCGYSDHETPVTDRLLEFARESWGNKAFRQMTFGLFCPSATFCQQDVPGAPVGIDHPRGLEILHQVQQVMASYVAVGVMEYWDLSMQLFNARVRSPVPDWNQFRLANSGKTSGLRDEVLQWAHMSADIHQAIGADILLYTYALAIFRQQTAQSLGTDWSEPA
ncbi:unnamed protein product [Scytosiphon promiscuus]